MNTNLTYIAFILDRSGSMGSMPPNWVETLLGATNAASELFEPVLEGCA